MECWGLPGTEALDHSAAITPHFQMIKPPG